MSWYAKTHHNQLVEEGGCGLRSIVEGAKQLFVVGSVTLETP